MSQTAAIAQHLEAGHTITPAEAYVQFGCLALHSRIAELRDQGYRVEKIMHHEHGKKWGEYFIGVAHG